MKRSEAVKQWNKLSDAWKIMQILFGGRDEVKKSIGLDLELLNYTIAELEKPEIIMCGECKNLDSDGMCENFGLLRPKDGFCEMGDERL